MDNFEDLSKNLADKLADAEKLAIDDTMMELDDEDLPEVPAALEPEEQSRLEEQMAQQENDSQQQGEPFIQDDSSAGKDEASSEVSNITAQNKAVSDESAGKDKTFSDSVSSKSFSQQAESLPDNKNSGTNLSDKENSNTNPVMKQDGKDNPSVSMENNKEKIVSADSDVHVISDSNKNGSNSNVNGTSDASKPSQDIVSQKTTQSGSGTVLTDSAVQDKKEEDVSSKAPLKMDENEQEGTSSPSDEKEGITSPETQKNTSKDGLNANTAVPESSPDISSDEILTSPEIDTLLVDLSSHENTRNSYASSLEVLKGTEGYNSILQSKENEDKVISDIENQIKEKKISLYEEKKKENLSSVSSRMTAILSKLPSVPAMEEIKDVDSALTIAKSFADKAIAKEQEAKLKAETVSVPAGRFSSIDIDGLKSLYLAPVPLYEDFLSKISDYEKELNDARNTITANEQRLNDAALLLEKMGYYPDKDINRHFLKIDQRLEDLNVSIKHLSDVIEHSSKNGGVSGGSVDEVSMDEIRKTLKSIGEEVSKNVTEDVDNTLKRFTDSVDESSKKYSDAVIENVTGTMNESLSSIFSQMKEPFDKKLSTFQESSNAMMEAANLMVKSSSAWSQYVHNVDKLSKNLDASTGMIPKQLDQLSERIFNTFQKQANEVSNDAARQVTSAVRRELSRSSSSIFPAPFNTPLASFLLQLLLTFFLFIVALKVVL